MTLPARFGARFGHNTEPVMLCRLQPGPGPEHMGWVGGNHDKQQSSAHLYIAYCRRGSAQLLVLGTLCDSTSMPLHRMKVRQRVFVDSDTASTRHAPALCPAVRPSPTAVESASGPGEAGLPVPAGLCRRAHLIIAFLRYPLTTLTTARAPGGNGNTKARARFGEEVASHYVSVSLELEFQNTKMGRFASVKMQRRSASALFGWWLLREPFHFRTKNDT